MEEMFDSHNSKRACPNYPESLSEFLVMEKKNTIKLCLTLTSPVENNLELLSTPDKGTEVFICSTKWSRSSFRPHYFGWPLKIHEQTELSHRDLLGDYLRLEEHFFKLVFLDLTPSYPSHCLLNFTELSHKLGGFQLVHYYCFCCKFSLLIHVCIIFFI